MLWSRCAATESVCDRTRPPSNTGAATAAETLRIAHNRYRNGYASYLEELDAQRTLYNADVGRLQLKTRILVASVDLYRAMGGGWVAKK